MQFSALPPFFIVKVEKTIQKENREKDGYFYTHADHVFMEREVQHGEIVSIGKDARVLFPDVKEGQTLIFHHFVTGREMENDGENRNLIFSDDTHNYYSVTVKSHKGEKNLTYGVFDGEKIIPHKDYIFLNIEKAKVEVHQTEAGLLTVENFTESRDELGNKMKEIKNEINELTKTKVSQELTQEIMNKETEMNKISKRVNKKQFQLYSVAYVSSYIQSLFKQPFTHVAVLNIACNTKILFDGIEYIVSETKYISGAFK